MCARKWSGAAHITFADPDFFNGPTTLAASLKRCAGSFPHLSYDVTIKIEHLLAHRELLPLLVKTGCAFVTSAVESVDDAVLEKLEKGHTRAGFIEAAALCRNGTDAGADVRGLHTLDHTRQLYRSRQRGR